MGVAEKLQAIGDEKVIVSDTEEIKKIVESHELGTSIQFDFKIGEGHKELRLMICESGNISLLDIHDQEYFYGNTQNIYVDGLESILNSYFEIEKTRSKVSNNVHEIHG